VLGISGSVQCSRGTATDLQLVQHSLCEYRHAAPGAIGVSAATTHETPEGVSYNAGKLKLSLIKFLIKFYHYFDTQNSSLTNSIKNSLLMLKFAIFRIDSGFAANLRRFRAVLLFHRNPSGGTQLSSIPLCNKSTNSARFWFIILTEQPPAKVSM